MTKCTSDRFLEDIEPLDAASRSRQSAAERAAQARRIVRESVAGEGMPASDNWFRSNSTQVRIPRATPTQTAEFVRRLRDACDATLAIYEDRPPLSAEKRTVQLWTRSFFLTMDDLFRSVNTKRGRR